MGRVHILNMVCWMLKTRREIINPETEALLVSAAKKVSDNQDFYDAGIDIYGSFQDQYSKIEDVQNTYHKLLPAKNRK